jgi:mono/diheme cytochrome c family protein
VSATIAVAGPPDVANGRKIYAMACVACHGPEGRGAQLGPTLNAREFLAARTDAQLTLSIERGVVGTTMIAWAKARGGNLDDASIRDVVAYLRSWQPKAPSVPDWKTRRPTH